METDCDQALQLMLWKKDNGKEEIKCIQCKDEGVRNIWNFYAKDEIITGIGLLSSNFAILRSFVFRRSISTSMLT